MTHPLVSVVIPNYNYARYLDKRISSILNQTYQNFEIIILDDKSTDNSVEVIEKYRNTEHVSQIVINEVNSGGVFNQWNKGIELAKGDLIWIAEADDLCDNTLLEKLVNEFEKDDNCVLAFARSLFVDKDLKPLFEHPKMEGIEHWNGVKLIKKSLRVVNIIANASSALFKRETALKIDKQYTSYRGAGDLLFWIEICENGNVAIVNEYLNYFRRHNANVTSNCDLYGYNIKEQKKIHDYLVGKQILSPIEKLKSVLKVTSWILYNDFANENIRRELIQLWESKWYIRLLTRIVYNIKGNK